MNRLYFNAIVKSLKEGEFEVVASNAKIDRFGDTINPDGWVLTNYRKNPVILWSHSTGGFAGPAIPPVARATKVKVEDGQLKVKGVFAPTPFAQELRTLVEEGFLNAVSVGFLPLVEDEKGMIEVEGKMYRRANEEELKDFTKGHKEGTKFEKQELLEVSWVNVPALPSALVSARKMGLALITKELETKIVIKPYENEHSCRLQSPDKYNKFRRENCAVKSDGKCIDFIYGILSPKKSELQAMRYNKEVWTEASAKSHCKEKDGTFEPASKAITYECECIDCGHKMTTEKHCKDIKCPKCGGEMRRVERPGPGKEIKEGRVISEKNRKLINNSIKQMGVAIDALRALLKATEQPEKDIAPEVKGRSQGKAKGGRNPELRLMLLTNKAVENTLRDLKKKSGHKTEIQLLRIASKVVDAVITKAKAKK